MCNSSHEFKNFFFIQEWIIGQLCDLTNKNSFLRKWIGIGFKAVKFQVLLVELLLCYQLLHHNTLNKLMNKLTQTNKWQQQTTCLTSISFFPLHVAFSLCVCILSGYSGFLPQSEYVFLIGLHNVLQMYHYHNLPVCDTHFVTNYWVGINTRYLNTL